MYIVPEMSKIYPDIDFFRKIQLQNSTDQRIEGILEMISVVKSDHSTMLIKVITVASKKNDMFAWTCIRQPL
jgi:hypothetical protein